MGHSVVGDNRKWEKEIDKRRSKEISYFPEAIFKKILFKYIGILVNEDKRRIRYFVSPCLDNIQIKQSIVFNVKTLDVEIGRRDGEVRAGGHGGLLWRH